jgi:CheY-like chemotaxis protein
MTAEQGKKTVLIVDDTELFIQLQITHLGRLRFNIHTAKNGEEGLKKARELKPDLILLDFLMPDMNGDVVCRILKGDPETSSIPIVILSSGAKDHSRSIIDSSRCDGLIYKPVRKDLLLSVVENLLKTNQRMYDRLDIHIPCTVFFEGNTLDGSIHILGGNGAFVEVDQKLIRGDVIGISFKLPVTKDNIEVESAAVVWCGTLNNDGPDGAGIKFMTMDPEAREQVGEFVQMHIGKDQVVLNEDIEVA